MITRLLSALILLATNISSGTACISADRSQGPLAIVVPCDDFQKPGQQRIIREANARVGQAVEVTLCSNASTGFQWEDAAIGDAGVVAQLDRRSGDPQTGMPGAAGNEKWTFKALKTGQSDISMRYSRPWEGGEKGIWMFTLKVIVK